MEKKLYRVGVVLFVMAGNESEARMAATQAHFDIFECAAAKAEAIDPEWKDATPYNADDERTCGEIMPVKRPVTHQMVHPVKLPAYVKAGIQAFDRDNRYSQPGRQA